MADQRLVTVREAARVARVPKTMVHWLLEQGVLPAQPDPQGPLIPLAAIRAFLRTVASPPPRQERAPAPAPREYVPPYIAARLTGVAPSVVSAWSRRGIVATMGGTYGRLVRLADVQALVQQRRGPARKAGDRTGPS